MTSQLTTYGDISWSYIFHTDLCINILQCFSPIPKHAPAYWWPTVFLKGCPISVERWNSRVPHVVTTTFQKVRGNGRDKNGTGPLNWMTLVLVNVALHLESLVIFYFFTTAKIHGSYLNENFGLPFFCYVDRERQTCCVWTDSSDFFLVRVAAQIPIRLIVTKIQEIQKTFGAGRGVKAFRGHGCHFSWIHQDVFTWQHTLS